MFYNCQSLQYFKSEKMMGTTDQDIGKSIKLLEIMAY